MRPESLRAIYYKVFEIIILNYLGFGKVIVKSCFACTTISSTDICIISNSSDVCDEILSDFIKKNTALYIQSHK